MQLAHCEETNLQLVSELDEKEAELSRMEKETSSRMRSIGDENEQLKRANETLRLKIGDLSAESAFLSTNLKDALGKIELYEQQFAAAQCQAKADSVQLTKLNHDLAIEKVRLFTYYLFISINFVMGFC